MLADVGPGAVSVGPMGPGKTACSWCQVHGCMLSLTALETGQHREVGLSLRNMFSLCDVFMLSRGYDVISSLWKGCSKSSLGRSEVQDGLREAPRQACWTQLSKTEHPHQAAMGFESRKRNERHL